MRSSGGTKLLLDGSVVARMKSRIACFAGPSFQEASGIADWASAGVAREKPGKGRQGGERAEHEAAAQAIGTGGRQRLLTC